MSALVTQEQFDTAHDKVFQQVYVPNFMQKLASHGIVPSGPEEQQKLLQLGSDLRWAEMNNPKLKAAAAAKVSPLEKLAAHVNKIVGQTAQSSSVLAQQIKQAGELGATDPALAAAVMTMHAADVV